MNVEGGDRACAGPLIIPFPLPEWVTSNHRRSAEIRVYQALMSQLRAPWVVFYSRPWLGLDRDGRERDGEADFVLIHPDLGMLVVEVKGGRIERDATSEHWWSEDREGDRFSIRNPVQQAVGSKHRLLEKLRRLEGWNRRYITARHAVVFPDCVKPAEDLGPDMPHWLFAGIDEMGRLGAWVEERLEQHLPENQEPDALDDDGVEIVKRYFARTFILERPPAASLIADDEQIRILTDQQVHILDVLETVDRIAVPGPAGTGKTALACEKARRLARDGRRTLLTCYNRALAQQLKREFGDTPDLVISSFHSLCRAVAGRAHIELPPESESEDFFERVLPEALLLGLQQKPEERYAAVVVDEGQDFAAAWSPAVEALLMTPDCPLFVFYDDNQRVFGSRSSIAADIPNRGLRLTRILRNSRQIVDTIKPLIQRPFLMAGPEGQPVEWLETRGPLGASQVEDVLRVLLEERHIAPRDIAVIVPDSVWRGRIVIRNRIGRYPVADAEEVPGNTVVCETIRRFKGLERAVVVLVEPEAMIGDPPALYVGLTRARVLLVLLASVGRLAQLRILLR